MAVVLEQLKNETYPIVKWVGGKRQLMFELLKNLPKSYNRYFEPFIGGGALFFELQPDNAYISDMNEELINLYSVVRDSVDELIEDLSKHEVSKDLCDLKVDPKEFLGTLKSISANAPTAKNRVERANKYLDCDIAVRSSLRELYELPMSGDYIAGVIDVAAKKHAKRLNIENYINTGVLLFDIEKWMTDNITNKIFGWIGKNSDKIVLHDQDILNAALNGHINFIDEK